MFIFSAGLCPLILEVVAVKQAAASLSHGAVPANHTPADPDSLSVVTLSLFRNASNPR